MCKSKGKRKSQSPIAGQIIRIGEGQLAIGNRECVAFKYTLVHLGIELAVGGVILSLTDQLHALVVQVQGCYEILTIDAGLCFCTVCPHGIDLLGGVVVFVATLEGQVLHLHHMLDDHVFIVGQGIIKGVFIKESGKLAVFIEGIVQIKGDRLLETGQVQQRAVQCNGEGPCATQRSASQNIKQFVGIGQSDGGLCDRWFCDRGVGDRRLCDG